MRAIELRPSQPFSARCVVIYTLGMIAVGFALGFFIAQPEANHRPAPVMAEPGFEPDDEPAFDRRV